MSWYLHAVGTVDDIVAQVEKEQRESWRYLPLAERIIVSGLVGAMIECLRESASEYVRAGKEEPRFLVSGAGHGPTGFTDSSVAAEHQLKWYVTYRNGADTAAQ